MKFAVLFALTLTALTEGRIIPVRRAAFTQQNGQDAITLNNQFKSLTPSSSCQSGQNACVNDQFAQCVNGKFVLTPCAGGLICAALPLVNSAGTSITCTTAADRDARIAATGATGATNNAGKGGASGNNGKNGTANGNDNGNGGGNNSTSTGNDNGDPQTSLTLDPSVIAKGFENNGQDQPEAGQVASLTSSNNFINFCATVPQLPITNGQQVKTGSCNPAPMGVIAATTNMPSAKFQFPQNGATVEANQDFTVKLAVQHLDTGFFVNAQENYFSAPQQVNSAGDIQGHSHVVIEKLTSLGQTEPTNPNNFAFFKGLNEKAQGGVLSADVTGGLDEGVYRIASINTAANHQPCLVAIAQHGTLDDMAYFTVKKGASAGGNAGNGTDTSDNGNNDANNNNNNGGGKGGKKGKGGKGGNDGNDQ